MSTQHRAVIFDLFGTLVDDDALLPEPGGEYQRLLAQMSAAIGASPEAFAEVWAASYEMRMAGQFASMRAAIQYVAEMLGLCPTETQLAAAVRHRLEFVRSALVPRPDALAGLRRLKEAACRIGVISNCSADTAALWPETPFAPLVDAAILSCAVGLMKPDSRIYRLACERLGVPAEHCIYVADGQRGELAAAASLGMHAVLIRCSYRDPPGFRRPHVEEWKGPEVAWLSQIPPLLG